MFGVVCRLIFILCLQLDLWYVILNGAVEISHPEGRVETLCMGNSFGITPSLDRQHMNGEVRTKGDDSQVKQTDKDETERAPEVDVYSSFS